MAQSTSKVLLVCAQWSLIWWLYFGCILDNYNCETEIIITVICKIVKVIILTQLYFLITFSFLDIYSSWMLSSLRERFGTSWRAQNNVWISVAQRISIICWHVGVTTADSRRVLVGGCSTSALRRSCVYSRSTSASALKWRRSLWWEANRICDPHKNSFSDEDPQISWEAPSVLCWHSCRVVCLWRLVTSAPRIKLFHDELCAVVLHNESSLNWELKWCFISSRTWIGRSS